MQFIVMKSPPRAQPLHSDILPFRLYRRPDKPHLCAVTAIAKWWDTTKRLGLEQSGYVFRSRGQGGGNDLLSYHATDQLVRVSSM